VIAPTGTRSARLTQVAAARRRPSPLELGLFIEAPLIGLGWFLWNASRRHSLAVDLSYSFLPATRAVIHGLSPYPTGHGAVLHGTAYLYPPLVAYLTAPLLLLPTAVAAWVGTIAVCAAAAGALWLLEIRDWRCYGAVLLWKPALLAVQTANLSLPLLLVTALAWRYRDRLTCAVAVAVAVATKLFLWPLLVWLIATRRFRLGSLAALSAITLVIAPWAAIGFRGLRAYPALAHYANLIEGRRSYTIGALADSLGASPGAALAVSIVALAGLLAVGFVVGRRGDDRLSFTIAIVASLLCAPIAWLHYFVLLAAPVAIYRSRLSAPWLIPLAFWVCLAVNGGAARGAPPWQIAVAVATPFLLVASLTRRSGVAPNVEPVALA
jgi:hypothetical protein